MAPNPAAGPPPYWLKTAPFSDYFPTKIVHPLYLRLHGDGYSSVVLTQKPPVFLQGYLDIQTSEEGGVTGKGARQMFMSTKHPDRSWGLVVGKAREKVGWKDAAIVEKKGDPGFIFETREDGLEESWRQQP